MENDKGEGGGMDWPRWEREKRGSWIDLVDPEMQDWMETMEVDHGQEDHGEGDLMARANEENHGEAEEIVVLEVDHGQEDHGEGELMVLDNKEEVGHGPAGKMMA